MTPTFDRVGDSRETSLPPTPYACRYCADTGMESNGDYCRYCGLGRSAPAETPELYVDNACGLFIRLGPGLVVDTQRIECVWISTEYGKLHLRVSTVSGCHHAVTAAPWLSALAEEFELGAELARMQEIAAAEAHDADPAVQDHRARAAAEAGEGDAP